jgi:hypothetical protein
MPKKYVGLAFASLPALGPGGGASTRLYESDHGNEYVYRGGFYIPPHLEASWDATKTEQVATQAGAFPHYFTNAAGEKVIVTEFGANPCPLSSTLSPRKIRFYFSNGNSTSIPIGEVGTNIKVAYDGLKPLLEGDGITIICAHLIGEEWANLNDVAGVSFDPAESTAPAGNGSYYSGTAIDYVSEITNSSFPVRFKVLTNAGDPPGSELPPIFNSDGVSTCLGNVADSPFRCPSSSSAISHRRIIVNYKSDAIANSSEQRELPVKEIGEALNTCIVAAGARPGVFCVSYKGETRKNIHLLT